MRVCVHVVYVFMLLMCACFHATRVCVCSCCLCVLVFMLLVCACYVVAYVCMCSCCMCLCCMNRGEHRVWELLSIYLRLCPKVGHIKSFSICRTQVRHSLARDRPPLSHAEVHPPLSLMLKSPLPYRSCPSANS